MTRSPSGRAGRSHSGAALLTSVAALAFPGCLATAVHLPPPDEEPLSTVIGEFEPGEGGVLLWNAREENGSTAITEEVLLDLRATGVFTRVEDLRSGSFAEYDHARAPLRADWVVTSAEVNYEELDSVPEIPLLTVLTLGLVPAMDSTKVTEAFELTRFGADGETVHVIRVPGVRGRIIGLVPAAILALHPDWHLSGSEEALRRRSRDRLVKGILRIVLHRESRG